MTKINFELIAGIILIEATADDITGFFAFDTGANVTVLNTKYFRGDLNDAVHQVVNFDEEVKSSSDVYTKTLQKLSFAGIEKTSLNVACFDLEYVEEGLQTIKEDLVLLGVIGINIIRDYNILLDYENKTISFDSEEGFTKSTTIDFELVDETFTVIPVEINNNIYKMELDTGANACLINENVINVDDFEVIHEEMKAILIPSIRVGGKVFEEIIAVARNVEKLKEHIDIEGVIGYSILSTQRTIIDYRNKKIYFEETENETTDSL